MLMSHLGRPFSITIYIGIAHQSFQFLYPLLGCADILLGLGKPCLKLLSALLLKALLALFLFQLGTRDSATGLHIHARFFKALLIQVIIVIADELPCAVCCELDDLGDSLVKLTLTEGKYHEVKRICADT